MSSMGTIRSLRQEPQTPPGPAGITAQEVFNRITPVSVGAEELRRLALPAEARELVEIIAHSAARMARTARSLSRVSECPSADRTYCNPNDLVFAAVREFAPICRALGVSLSATPFSDCAPIRLDLADFQDGLALLIDVAIDACGLAKPGDSPRAEIRVEPRADGLAIVVRSNGEPISPHVQREVWASETAPAPSGGVALALYLAKMAANRSDGDLRVGNEQGWTRLEILLSLSHDRRREHLGRPSRSRLRVIQGDGCQMLGSRAGHDAGARIPVAEAPLPLLALAA